jgi:hypothetical protein
VNAFIFASNVNHPEVCPQFPNDATGGFIPGAKAFKEIHQITSDIFFFDHRDPDATKRQRVLHEIQTFPDKLELIAYFGHGVKNGLSSVGFYNQHAPDLAAAIRSNAERGIKVVLYACSAGALATDSFAATLARELDAADGVVFGHIPPPGHAFAYPHVSVFYGSDPGRRVIDVGAPLWSAWAKAIQAGNSIPPTKNSFWARFPVMTRAEIEEELGGPKPPTWRDQALTGQAALTEARRGRYE